MWRCPKCKGSIRIIGAFAAVIVFDDGVEQDSGFEWDDNAEAECTACTWKGIARDACIEEAV